MITFSIVVAVDLENGIGIDGRLPWRLPGDIKYFKELTIGATGRGSQNAVIMGRKTWESIPEKFRPLPERLNVVLTRNAALSFPKGVLKAEGLESALKTLNAKVSAGEIESVFVIGGGEIFRESIKNPLCQKLYVTHILKKFDCDTFFPHFQSHFKQISTLPRASENGLEYHFAVYEWL